MTVHELTLPIYEKSTYLTKSVACNYIIIQNDKKKKKRSSKRNYSSAEHLWWKFHTFAQFTESFWQVKFDLAYIIVNSFLLIRFFNPISSTIVVVIPINSIKCILVECLMEEDNIRWKSVLYIGVWRVLWL